MELKDFVSETILSIISGVEDAQKKAKEHDAFVNPGGLLRNTSNVSTDAILDNSTNIYAQPVLFDIAITAEDSAQIGAKVKVFSGIFGGGINGEKESKNAIVSRVRFTVPVFFPGQDVGKPEARMTRGPRVISEGIKS